MMQAWQNYYLLIGTAAATLAGLLFVGITFSVGAIKGDVEKVVRVWGEPPLYDFVQVLAIACLAQFPELRPSALGGALLAWVVWRAWRLVEVAAFLKSLGPQAEIVWEDWTEKVWAPALFYGGLAAAALGLVLSLPWAPLVLALDCLGTLAMGIYSTWTQLVWMAAQKTQGPKRK